MDEMTKILFVSMKKGGNSVKQDWLGGRVVDTLVLLVPILDPSSMEQYATAETWKNCNLRSKHYVWGRIVSYLYI